VQRSEITGDVSGFKVMAIDEELEFGGEANPPTGRLDFGDDGSGRWRGLRMRMRERRPAQERGQAEA
jgi:hypothetical protein